MKFSIIDDNNFNVYINNEYLMINDSDESELYNYLKKVLINIRKKYNISIYGFFEVNIYIVNNIATILQFTKKDDDNFMCKTVDLKVIKHSSNNIYLKFEDYYLIEKYKKVDYYNNYYYLRADDIKKEDINRLIEYFDVVIGKYLDI